MGKKPDGGAKPVSPKSPGKPDGGAKPVSKPTQHNGVRVK